MNKYELKDNIGDGAFGSVVKAINSETKEIVAIKTMKKKFKTFEECKNLKEKKILEQLKKHENIIKLHEMILVNDTLMFVFEYMEQNILSLINNMSNLDEDQIRGIMHQIVSGLAHMHKYGYFHRDLKPENLLCKENKIKICDFGLAKEIRSIPPFTEYVSTRWYRSPELLLRSTHYSSPVDIWALGCIMSELFTKKPLFPGTSEKDQLAKIVNLLGSPVNWQEGLILAKKIDFKFNMNNSNSTIISNEFSKLHPNVSSDAINLMKEMLRWDPSKRPTAHALLGHPFFTKNIIKPLVSPKHSNEIVRSSISSDLFNNGNSFSNRKNIKGNGNSSNILDLLMNTGINKYNNNNNYFNKNNAYECNINKQDTPEINKILENITKNNELSASSTSSKNGYNTSNLSIYINQIAKTIKAENNNMEKKETVIEREQSLKELKDFKDNEEEISNKENNDNKETNDNKDNKDIKDNKPKEINMDFLDEEIYNLNSKYKDYNNSTKNNLNSNNTNMYYNNNYYKSNINNINNMNNYNNYSNLNYKNNINNNYNYAYNNFNPFDRNSNVNNMNNMNNIPYSNRVNYFSEINDNRKKNLIVNHINPHKYSSLEKNKETNIINKLLLDNKEREEAEEIINQFNNDIDLNKENRRNKLNNLNNNLNNEEKSDFNVNNYNNNNNNNNSNTNIGLVQGVNSSNNLTGFKQIINNRRKKVNNNV